MSDTVYSDPPPTTITDTIPNDLSGHIVIINVNEKLPQVIREIQKGWPRNKQVDIVVFIQNRTLWDDHPRWHPEPSHIHHLYVIEGCPGNTSELVCTHIDTCQTAIILADPTQGKLSDAKGTLIALAIEKTNPNVHTLIEVVKSGHRTHLIGTEVNEVVCMGELTERLLAQNVITPGVLKTINTMLSVAPNPGFTAISMPDEFIGLTYEEIVTQSIRNETSHIICGYVREAPNAGTRTLIRHPIVNPDSSQKKEVLQQKDALIIIE